MKRLIKKAFSNSYDIGEKVRFPEKSQEGFYTIVSADYRDNTYVLEKDGETINDVDYNEIVSEDEFTAGDKVIFKKHPYDDTLVFVVKEVLADGTYFIESGENAFTGINGKNLELII